MYLDQFAILMPKPLHFARFWEIFPKQSKISNRNKNMKYGSYPYQNYALYFESKKDSKSLSHEPFKHFLLKSPTY